MGTPEEVIREQIKGAILTFDEGRATRCYDESRDCLIEALAAAGYVIVEEKLLKEVSVTMKHARIFVTSREKIKQPEGIYLYDCCLTLVDIALAAAPNAKKSRQPEG